jgi:hypothetical protein
MTKRGRVSWRRTAEQALGGVTLDARWLADGVLGVEVTAYAAPLALFELVDEGVVGRDFNAMTIAWSLRQQEAGAPDCFELALSGVDERVLAAIESYVRDQALPALDKLLVPGALHAHIRAVASGSALVNPPQFIQAVAGLVSEGDAALVPPLVVLFGDISVEALKE